ncbi:MAG: site-specific integrase [Ruminococcus sp.]|nr:site-specific integrase [Ruminococcus sp.]
MATARKLPSGSWRVRVYDNKAKKYKSFTAGTKREAERLGAVWLAEHERETDPFGAPTFKAAAEAYIDEKIQVLSPTTIQGYRAILKNSTSRLNDLKITEITPRLVQDWINGLTVEKAAKTVRNVYGFFTAVLTYHDIDIKLSKITLPKKAKKFKRLPTAEVVLDTFRGSDIEIPVLLAVWCGMRISEILGVQKADIHNGILTINRVVITINNKIVAKDVAKTYESNRQIKLAEPILYLIDGINCPDDTSIVQLSRKQVYDRFVKAMKAQGYNITFHDLRHINASIMAMLNIPDLYAMQRGGWSNTTTLKQVYQQTFDDERKRVDKVIDDYFQALYDMKI